MKKTISLFCAVLMLALCAVCVNAETQEFQVLGCDFTDCGENVNLDFQSSEDGSSLALSLKPLDAATAATTWWDFELEIPFDGYVQFTFTYSAKKDRYMDVTFNGTTQKVTCPDTGGFGSGNFSKLTISYEGVKAGKQTLRLGAPADYCEDIKTPNIDYFDIIVSTDPITSTAAEPETEAETTAPETEPETTAPETEPETTAPETEPETTAPETEPETAAPETAPETTAPETVTTVTYAPQTFDIGIIAAAAAVVTAAGYALSKKK